jgi:hypothetical protein
VWGRNASAGRFVAIIITTPKGCWRVRRDYSRNCFFEGEKQKTCNLRSKKGADFVCQKITD